MCIPSRGLTCKTGSLPQNKNLNRWTASWTVPDTGLCIHTHICICYLELLIMVKTQKSNQQKIHIPINSISSPGLMSTISLQRGTNFPGSSGPEHSLSFLFLRWFPHSSVSQRLAWHHDKEIKFKGPLQTAVSKTTVRVAAPEGTGAGAGEGRSGGRSRGATRGLLSTHDHLYACPWSHQQCHQADA